MQVPFFQNQQVLLTFAGVEVFVSALLFFTLFTLELGGLPREALRLPGLRVGLPFLLSGRFPATLGFVLTGLLPLVCCCAGGPRLASSWINGQSVREHLPVRVQAYQCPLSTAGVSAFEEPPLPNRDFS